MSTEYDAIVVGSGAAGGWAAKTLAEQGIRVLVLEAGPLLGGDQRVDRAAHSALRQPVQSLCSAYETGNSHLFVDDLDHPYQTSKDTPFHWFRGRQAGGRLPLWAGVSLRLSDHEFSGEATRQCGGESRSWPIGHDQLAPYYAQVESFMRVSGGGEHSPNVPAPATVTAREFTRGERRLATAIEARRPGRRLLSGRIAHAEAGAVLGKALCTGRVTLRPDAVVSHLEMTADGRRADGVVFVDRITGVSHRARAATVVLAASAIESVRILLNSRSRHHPDGLGGNRGLLGRYFFDHVAGVSVAGVVPDLDARPHPRPGPGFVPVCHIPDFRDGDRGFPGGYGITVFAPEVLPLNGRSAAWALESGAVPFRMWASGEVLPSRDNRVTLADETDAFGVPQARVRLAYGTAENAMAAHQAAEMRAMADAAGFTVTEVCDRPATPGSSVHEMGGAAMGASARDSVVGPDNRLWDVPNVVVADAACFTTGGWQNPTLTIMALAARACDRLARAARSGEPTCETT